MDASTGATMAAFLYRGGGMINAIHGQGYATAGAVYANAAILVDTTNQQHGEDSIHGFAVARPDLGSE